MAGKHGCSAITTLSILFYFYLLFPITFSLSLNNNGTLEGCYKSIVSFGDSIADTGNLLQLHANDSHPPHFAFPPYGETFFGHPTGRFSDGRLIIDFIAQDLGLPLVRPYFGRDNSNATNIEQGVNFAVAGATALNKSFFDKLGIHKDFTNYSLGVQLDLFKKMLPSACQTHSDCKNVLQSSLILMGEIGGNDFNNPFFAGISIKEIRSFISPVINTIASAINDLIKIGAVTVMVPGNFPIGCSPYYLTVFKSSRKEDYDPETGCLKWLNEFSEYYNEMLQKELSKLRELNKHAIIIYADYYNATLRLIRSPEKYGFTEKSAACCGGGGSYNVNTSVQCGYAPSKVCNEPSKFVNWDGIHLTEAAYKWIAKGLLEGPFTIPPLNASCLSKQTGYFLA